MNFTYVEQLMQQGLQDEVFTSANILVGRGDEILFHAAYGRNSVEPDSEPTTPDTRYDMASVSKNLGVGMIALRSIEKGLIALSDTLSLFVDAPEDKKDITIKQILTHTAGFHPSIPLWNMNLDPADAVAAILREPLICAPGTEVHYSCTGFILLGKILEKLYGMNLKELAQQEVFGPLGMTHTCYQPEGGNIAATERQPDGRCLMGVVHDENARWLDGISGNAGVFSTAGDMAKYAQMIACGGAASDGSHYLSAATLRVAMTNHTPGMSEGRGLAFYLPGYDVSFIGDLFPQTTIGHTGFTGTSYAIDPVSGVYLILLTNRVCPTRENAKLMRLRRVIHNAVYSAV